MAKPQEVRNDIAIVSPSLNHPQLACLHKFEGISRNNVRAMLEVIKELEIRRETIANTFGKKYSPIIREKFLGFPKQILDAIANGEINPHAIILNRYSLSTKDYEELIRKAKSGKMDVKNLHLIQFDHLPNWESGGLVPIEATKELIEAFQATRKEIKLIFLDDDAFPIGSISSIARDNLGKSERRFYVEEAIGEIMQNILKGNHQISENDWPPHFNQSFG